MRCPHCKKYGNLILHGYLISFKNGDMRGHRIFCSNRGRKNGCGRTWSVLQSRILPNMSFDANTLWRIFHNYSTGIPKLTCLRQTGASWSTSSLYRIFRLLQTNQSHIRSLLVQIDKPPDTQTSDPLVLTIEHLQKLCLDSPIAMFQQHFQIPFFPHRIQPIPLR